MELTVCICTHNRPDHVRDCLDGLRRQTAASDSFKVLVVDSGSTGDGPAALERLVATLAGAELLRMDQPGLSAARNGGAWTAHTPYIAYLNDDAIPAPDWVATILAVLGEQGWVPALIGGRILPRWGAPLPDWWPPNLRGILSIIEHEGSGVYRSGELPPGLQPYGTNMVVHVLSLLAVGGFATGAGRLGRNLLSDEEVQLAWRLQEAGHRICYNSRIVVEHQIHPERLTPAWLLSRLYWQGVSAVLTHRMLQRPGHVWWELPRRLAVAALCVPSGVMARHSVRFIPLRWRLAYAAGFIHAALGGYSTTAERCPTVVSLRGGVVRVADPV